MGLTDVILVSYL